MSHLRFPIIRCFHTKSWQNPEQKKIRKKWGVEPFTLETVFSVPALYTGQPDAYPTVLDHYFL